MRILPAYVQGARLRDYEKSYLGMVRDAVTAFGAPAGITLVDDPSRADVIVLWEAFEYKTPAYIETLERDPMVRSHAERICSINYDDHPEGFLRGIYTSLEQPFFDPAIHRSWPFMLMNNPLVCELRRDEVLGWNPRYLFSFAGARSHPVRGRLFDTFARPSDQYVVTHVNKWYNHNDSERRRFVQLALDSVFCLCPHGYCAYTPRITEVMAMARVPVIVADDWIPFSFEETHPYYVRVAEKDISHLPDILAQHRPCADEYRRNARALWEKYCAPGRSVIAALQCIESLAASPASRRTFDEYRERWHSNELLSQLGWTWPQQLALRVEQRARHWLPNARLPGVSPLVRYRNTAHKA